MVGWREGGRGEWEGVVEAAVGGEKRREGEVMVDIK